MKKGWIIALCVLLVLGAAEGSFPAFQKQQSLISEEERTQDVAKRCATALPCFTT